MFNVNVKQCAFKNRLNQILFNFYFKNTIFVFTSKYFVNFEDYLIKLVKCILRNLLMRQLTGI